MKHNEVYKLIKDGRYNDAAFMLLDSASPQPPLKINSPGDAFPLLRKYGAKRKEYFIVLILNGAHEIVREEIVSIGLMNRTVVHPREVFYPAILYNSAAVLIAHNHPSGNLTPSPEDREITSRLHDSAKILGIALLDHLIISSRGYYSFIEHGLLEPFTAD
ncbi:MAG TPA: JAB domain-containing protein [Rectinemataceae bacterium]|nr:JAB domain-containing protein [Rectinemataceae bacterium]